MGWICISFLLSLVYFMLACSIKICCFSLLVFNVGIAIRGFAFYEGHILILYFNALMCSCLFVVLKYFAFSLRESLNCWL